MDARIERRRPYEEVHQLLESSDAEDGRMWWQAGGAGGGGQWILELRGRVRKVPFHDHNKNALDELYVPLVDDPQVVDDFSQTLKDDAFWRLIELFRR